MSWTAIWSIFCDGVEEDGRPCPEWVAEELTKALAKRTASSYGWQVRGYHLCPRHRSTPDQPHPGL